MPFSSPSPTSSDDPFYPPKIALYEDHHIILSHEYKQPHCQSTRNIQTETPLDKGPGTHCGVCVVWKVQVLECGS
jgi:hypothetical protein